MGQSVVRLRAQGFANRCVWQPHDWLPPIAWQRRLSILQTSCPLTCMLAEAHSTRKIDVQLYASSTRAKPRRRRLILNRFMLKVCSVTGVHTSTAYF